MTSIATEAEDPPRSNDGAPTRADRTRLVLLSALVLFLELALIRWTGDNVYHLSFFSNFVLLGSFLGIGIGFLRARRARNMFPYAPIAIAILIAFVLFFPVKIEATGNQLIYFGELNETGPPRELVLTIIFLVVAAAMAFTAEGLARTFGKFEPLEAYKFDLIGSIVGIVAFSAIAFLRAPPLAWGIAVVVLLLFVDVMPTRRTILKVAQLASLVSIIVLLCVESFAGGTSWSPYYKIEETANGGILVNGVGHQSNLPSTQNPTYTTIYDHLPDDDVGRVLIIGAGGGNDVSVALARGAESVDAVEIDPRLQQIGEQKHPDRPYQDPRVSAHINDGRAFLEQSKDEYDLILFALPDSLVLVPGQATVRLESFLFTKEAMESAREHLAPGGVFAMYNYYRENWLIDRLGRTLHEVFGTRPCLDAPREIGNFAVFLAGESQSDLDCATRWTKTEANPPDPATDDHPFPYLQNPSIPSNLWITALLILGASIVAVRVFGGRFRTMSSYVDLFFMGVAFLLLETRSLVQFALLFGTTWFVNALVFLGILLTVLAAVAVSRRVTFKRPAWLYVLLLAALAVAWAVPTSSLLTLSSVPRFLAATALAFTPIFIANLVFTQRFKESSSSTTAFGANLLGAMVGGLLEYLALLVGYRSLLLVVALAYGAAFLFGRRHLRSPAPAPTGG